LLLVVVPFVAVTILQVDRTIKVMVLDLERTGNLLIGQIFERIRTDSNGAQQDAVTALRADPTLSALVASSLDFGPGVVYGWLETSNGQTIAVSGTAAAAPPSFATLKREAASWWPWAPIAAVWGSRTYEMRKEVNLANRPFAVIRIGLSTALIDTEARRSVYYIISVGAAGVVLALVAAMLVSKLLREPIAALISSAEALTPGGEMLNSPAQNADELETVVEKFNQLAARIKKKRAQWETERGQFFNIFRSINDAVILLDASGAVLFANAEACHRLALPISGGLAEGKPLRLLLGGNHPLIRAIETATATGTELRDAALELTGGQTPDRLLVSLFALGHGPEPPGMLVVARDLKLMTELEMVVEHSDRLVRLGSIISGVAHQLRTPLNAMNLQLELLSHDVERAGNGMARVRGLRDEIRRLDRTIDALLRFMRPEQLKPATVPLNSLLTEVAGAVRKPELVVEFGFDSTVLAITADRALLAEALRNIVVNAAEAMPQGGLLTIATQRLPHGFVEIRVSDQGSGINDTSQIFNLYYTTKKGGSGLGLPLALRAVDLHHGTIEVDSQPGVGTTVSIRLPIGVEHTTSAHREIA
jgi:signal transduction histidine kinase